MRVLLDTCAIIWAVSDPDRLSDAARSIMVHVDTKVFVSPI
jgi:PIN domain nuclease of toxin-antitoxin system